jgi:hypothetical protein
VALAVVLVVVVDVTVVPRTSLVVVLTAAVVDVTVVPRTPLVVVLTVAVVDVAMEAAVVDVDGEVYW